MASYKTLKKGSSGQDVVDLQNKLISAGYNVGASGADGIFGKNTENALKQYQNANGLTADGIAGEQTLSFLYGGSADTKSTNAITTLPNGQPIFPDIGSMKYDPGTDQTYQDAMNALNQAKENMPTYNKEYEDNLSAIYDEITNRGKFSYDINEDALYQQYANQYKTLGELASLDTMGKAAAMTGGYGNSFAQSVGQQAYQSYLQQLNDRVPELAAFARQQYDQEGQDMLNRYSLMSDMRDTELSKYSNDLYQYWQNLQYQKQLADQAYDRGYTSAKDSISSALNQYSAMYSAYRDEIADEQWRKDYDLQKQQYKQSVANANKKEMDPEVAMLQQTLKDAGVYTGDVTGLWDSSTIKAISDYNAKNPDSPISLSGSNDTSGSKNSNYTGVTDKIYQTALSFKSATAVRNYVNGLVGSGQIYDYEGDALYEDIIATKMDEKVFGENSTIVFPGGRLPFPTFPLK